MKLMSRCSHHAWVDEMGICHDGKETVVLCWPDKESKWKTKLPQHAPTQITYERVRAYCPNATWCTYVLAHPTFVGLNCGCIQFKY